MNPFNDDYGENRWREEFRRANRAGRRARHYRNLLIATFAAAIIGFAGLTWLAVWYLERVGT